MNLKSDNSLEMHRLSGQIESHQLLRLKFQQVFARNSQINFLSSYSLVLPLLLYTLLPLLLHQDPTYLRFAFTIRFLTFSTYCLYARKMNSITQPLLRLVAADNAVENSLRQSLADTNFHYFALVNLCITDSITSPHFLAQFIDQLDSVAAESQFFIVVFVLLAFHARFKFEPLALRLFYCFLLVWNATLRFYYHGNCDTPFILLVLGLVGNLEILHWRQQYNQAEYYAKLAEYDREASKLYQQSEYRIQSLAEEIQKKSRKLATSRGEDILKKLRMLKYAALLRRTTQNPDPFDQEALRTAPNLKQKISSPNVPSSDFIPDCIQEERRNSIELQKPRRLSKHHSYTENHTLLYSSPSNTTNNKSYPACLDKLSEMSDVDGEINCLMLEPDEIDDLIKIVVGRKDSMWLPQFLRSRTHISSTLELIQDDEIKDEETISPEARKFIIDHFTEKEFNFLDLKQECCLQSPVWHINIGKDLTAIVGADGDFNFDFFELCDNGIQCAQIFIQYSTYAFLKFNVHKTLNISNYQKMIEFFKRLESLYLTNPYHNSTHAMDVANSCAFFLQNGLSVHASEFEKACLLISALAHDVGHPGLNNGFMVASKSKQALIYNDQSVLESYHASILFHILWDEKSNIIENVPEVDKKGFRKYCLSLILDTDLQKHFPILSKFKNFSQSEEKNLEDEQNRLLILSMAIKCADIGHGAKSQKLHRNWSRRINEEFFAQGDLEKELQMSVSPMCDRSQSITKSQEGFLKAIVLPIYESFKDFLGNEKIEQTCISQIYSNIQYWQQQQKEEAEHGQCSFYKDTNQVIQIMQKFGPKEQKQNYFTNLWI